jgi:hypothetical protein
MPVLLSSAIFPWAILSFLTETSLPISQMLWLPREIAICKMEPAAGHEKAANLVFSYMTKALFKRRIANHECPSGLRKERKRVTRFKSSSQTTHYFAVLAGFPEHRPQDFLHYSTR